MASNPLPNGINELMTRGADNCDGLHNHGVAVGVVQNTETAVRNKLNALIAAQGTYNAALSAKSPLGTAVTVADSNAKAFIGRARRIFIESFGDGYSQDWDATGFPDNSTAVPNTQEKRQALMQSLKNYLSSNPAFEVNTPKIVFTAAKADTLFTALATARVAAADGNTFAGQKKALRDAAEIALRTRMSGLIAELGQLLDDTDPLWLAFGLNEPGAPALPDPADGLVLTAGGTGVVIAHWTAGSRSLHSRIYKQVVGVDVSFVNLGLVDDSDHTFTGLPSGQTVRIQIIATNNAGDATPIVAEIVVP